MNSVRTDYACDNTGRDRTDAAIDYSDRDFQMVYRYAMCGQSVQLLAWQEGITVKEVEAIIAAHSKVKT